MIGTSQMKPVDQEKLNAFLGKVIEDFGAALSGGADR